MEAEFTITERDFIDASKLAAKKQNRFSFILMVFVLPASVAIPAIFDNSSAPGTYFLFSLVAILVFAMYVFVILLISKFVQPQIFRWQYKKNRLISQPQTLTLLPEGLNFKTEGSVFNLRWEQIHKWKEDEESVVVYSQPFCFHPIPKRISSSGFDVDELTTSLRRLVPSNPPNRFLPFFGQNRK